MSEVPFPKSASAASGEAGLAPYAVRAADSRGRRHPEPEHPLRSAFQRDRDRIIHATAFRRLEYKTQVFLNHEGDHYRTRLTHTLEVTQISRTLARALALNEDLAEAVALAHDLGHTPFGHAGERELDRLTADHGGFEHNRQGLRVVDWLERRYPDFRGLNLSFEVREAFLRHGTAHDHPAPDGLPLEFLAAGPGTLLEIQATTLADEIAYDNHDIDDGLASGILREEELMDLRLWRRALVESDREWSDMPPGLRRAEGVRRLINLLVTDAVATSRARIAAAGLDSTAAVRAWEGERLIALSPTLAEEKAELEDYLLRRFYRDYRVRRTTGKARRFLRQLFEGYVAEPEELPEEARAAAEAEGVVPAVRDYLAGMTDRYALEEYRKMYAPDI